jgi:type IV secretory pathway VirB4 component
VNARRGAASRAVPFSRPSGRLTLPASLRLAAHRASSATLAAAYPFLAARPCTTGALVGMDALTGGPFCFDPWALYAAGELTNPNVVLAGVIGQGKSALAKSFAVRAIATGRRVYVPGDPKGEWAPVAEAVGGVVVRLRAGGATRLNPLDAHGADSDRAHAPRLRLLTALAETTLRRDLRPAEHGALDAAMTAVEHRPQPTLPDVVAALAEPTTSSRRARDVTVFALAEDGRDLVHGLRRLIRGDLAGLFDGPSTQVLDASAPMTVLDLSGLGSNDEALALAMTCASGWLEHALTGASAKRWVIYDEAWRLLRSVPAVRRMQAQWKLSRAYGIANLMILHRLSDLDAVGAAGTEARALADGLLADCSTRIVYRQESDQLTATQSALGLTVPERDLLPALGRGTGLWKMPRRTHVVHHHLTGTELALFDTDAAMREAT